MDKLWDIHVIEDGNEEKTTIWIVFTDTMLNERNQPDTKELYRCVGIKFKTSVKIVITFEGWLLAGTMRQPTGGGLKMSYNFICMVVREIYMHINIY